VQRVTTRVPFRPVISTEKLEEMRRLTDQRRLTERFDASRDGVTISIPASELAALQQALGRALDKLEQLYEATRES
jgi:hypothetical protein